MSSEAKHLPPELEHAFGERPEQVTALRATWDALGAVPPAELDVPDRDEAWRELEARIRRPLVPAAAPDRHPRRRTIRVERRVTWSAVGVLAVLLGAVGLWWSQPVVVEVPPGTQQIVLLPDESAVELNSDSELRYARGFRTVVFTASTERRVRLRGEAFFQVSSNPSRPFVVETPDARIEVVGTAFNVRSRETTQGVQTLVTLQEGVIRVVSHEEDRTAVVLDSIGASVLVQAGKAPQTPSARARLEHVLAWRDQGFAAIDEPVGEILREVQRRYSVALELEPGLPTDAEMTLFYLRGTSAEQIVHDLCLSRGWQYRPTSRGFYVYASERGTRSGSRSAL